MARTSSNLLTQTYSGKVGKQFVFRTRGNKSIIAALPKGSGLDSSPTTSQLEIRRKFQKAVIYAKKAIQNPAMLEAYTGAIRGNQTAFNVAFKDAYKGPEISNLRTDLYKGAAGDTILVEAIDNFRVSQVKFTLTAADGTLIDEGLAQEDENGYDWVFTTKVENPSPEGTRIRITAQDIPKNEAVFESVL